MSSSITSPPGLADVLVSIGLSWDSLRHASREIVLFGSRAANLAHAGSDWDVLCVGHGRTRRTRHIDLLWVTPEELCSEEWLSSELAGHVATHGRWLAGEPSWLAQVRSGTRAQVQKRRWLVHRLDAWERSWPSMSPRLRRRYARMLRQNLQRYELLLQGRAVPPTPVLDRNWHSASDPLDTLRNLARRAAVDTPFVLHELTPLA